jgi:RNase P subunit RPR2
MAKRSRNPNIKHVLVRHHCSKCHSRLVPFDKFETRTESPELGKKDNPILLKTYNTTHREQRIAWCWSCNRFMTAERVGEAEILEMYMRRKGVRTRGEEA